MRITDLRLHNFRNAAQGAYRFSASRVLLLGPNGAGKSNLLEALGFLSVLRSFRGAPVREMVMLEKHEFGLAARIDCGNFRKQISLRERIGGGRELFEERKPVARASDFIRNFRTVVFAPEDRMIVAGGAAYRRRFFDMLISVLEPKYFSSLGSCNRALKQRNKALRSGGGRAAAYFDPVLAESAGVLTAFRREYAAMLEREVNRLMPSPGRFAVKCHFSAPEDCGEFLQLLARERDKELRRGATLYGPHLDDFELVLDGKPLRGCGSNGQIRLMSLYLKLAEFALIRRLAELPVLVLADDVTCELDAVNKRRFLELTQVADQSFFTFTQRPDEPFFSSAQEIVLPSENGAAKADNSQNMAGLR